MRRASSGCIHMRVYVMCAWVWASRRRGIISTGATAAAAASVQAQCPFWRAQQDGSPVPIGTRVVRGAVSATAADRIVDLLLQKGVVHETSAGELVVSADLYQMTLFDLYGLIPWELAVHEDLEGYDDDGSETFASLEKDVTVCLKETMAVPVALLLQDSTNQCI